MAVPSAPAARSRQSRGPWWTQVQAGTVGSLSVLAVVLTLGLLAYSPLGAAAARVGLTATFVTVAIGGLVYAGLGRAVLPAAGPSSATALILASLVFTLASDPRLAVASKLGVIVAGCGAAVALSGLLQWLIGRLGLAGLSRLVPRPVLAGFMNGVALLILLGQLPLLLGQPPGTLLTVQLLGSFSPGPLLLALGTVATIVLIRRARVRLPAALAALLLGSAVHALAHAAWPGLNLGPLIGAAPLQAADLLVMDAWRRPDDLALLLDHSLSITVTAVVLALIGALETLLNLLAHDQQVGARHDPGVELQAMGVCNLVCGLLGGLPTVMLRARAQAITQAGGQGRLAVAAGSAALGVLYTAGSPLLGLLPLPVLGGIMVIVAFSLIDGWTGRLLLRWSRGDSSAELRSGLLVMALVCLLTLWQGFAAGVASGVLLSMAIFIARMNRSLLRSRLSGSARPSRRIYPGELEARLQPLRQQIQVWELEGALFFGNADRLLALAEALPTEVRSLVLDLRRVSAIDETGATALSTLCASLQRRGAQVQLAGLKEGSAPARSLHAYGLTVPLQPDADRAIEAAEQLLLGPAAESTLSARPLIGCDLLKGLSSEQAAGVRAAMQELRLFDGEFLFRQGDAADGLYVLVLGSISVIAREGASTQRFLSISPGMMLGEAGMLDGGGRSADAMADTFAVLHHLSREALARIELEQPAVASRLHANIATYLSARLRAASAAWWASQQ